MKRAIVPLLDGLNSGCLSFPGRHLEHNGGEHVVQPSPAQPQGRQFGLRESRGQGDTEPGKIYAALLASGDEPYPFDSVKGTGHMKMPPSFSCLGGLFAGTRNVSHQLSSNVNFNIPSNRKNLKVAIWWPEGTTYHNDIDLRIWDSSSTLRGQSIDIPSVFEFQTVDGPLSPTGTWTLEIRGFDVPQSPQLVYYAIRFESC